MSPTPPSQRIVFAKAPCSSGAGCGDYDIWTVNPDGSDLRPVTNVPGNLTPSGDNEAPSWNGARKEIAFVSDYGAIMVIKADGSGLRQVTAFEDDRDPSFSPDGSQIAFVRKVSGTDTIFVVRADGSGLKRLTELTGDVFDPAFSPDGSYIAFSRMTQDRREIWVSRVDGSIAKVVVKSSDVLEQPDWSPDRSRLAYVRAGAVYVKILDSTEAPTKVVDDAGAPSFSPDGQWLAVRMGRSIYTVRGDGSGLRLVTGSSSDVSNDPDWGF